MKRGTPRHPKVIALAEQLGVEVFAAVGILELLWHFTAEFSPGGDIGRHSNAAIAKALFWRHKPDKLIQGLVAAKWVDLTEPDRLTVHDWSEHSDDTTHNKLARSKRFFSDGTAPSLKRLPPKDRASAEEFYGAHSGGEKAHAIRTESAFEAHSGLGLAMAKAKEVLKTQEANFELSDYFEKLYAAHPKKTGRMLAEQALVDVVSSSISPQSVMRRIAEAHQAQLPELSRDAGRYCPQLHKWLSDRKYMDDAPEPPQTLEERIASL